MIKWITIAWYTLMIVLTIVFLFDGNSFLLALPLGNGIYWSIRNIREMMR